MNKQADAAQPEMKNDKKKEKRLKVFSRVLRWTILASFLIFVLSVTSLHALGYVAPSIHGICPYGGLESMLSLITLGTFIKKIVIGTFILFIVTVVLAVAMRRSFCGQICAFGGLQEFFGKIGKKLFKKRPVIPRKLDRVLRYLKFVVLGITVAMAWITGELWITPYDPFNALGHLADFNALITSYLIGFIVLVATLLGSIVYDRFFCKYLCPAGALYGAIGQASPYSIRVDDDKCIKCGLCNKVCPMNVEVMNAKNGRVTDIECINCNECVNACPVKGAAVTGYSRKKALSPILATLLALAIFLVPILIARATGTMQLLPNKYVNTQSEESSNEENGEGEEGEVEITINGYAASDITGSMTLLQVSEMLDMTLDELYEKLNLPSDYSKDTTIKTAASYAGVEFSTFKHSIFE